jgi:hypothetical protein
MARARLVSVVTSNPEEAANAKPVVWKIGDPVPGNPEVIVSQLVLFNGGVTVFAVPSSGSKTELDFIQHLGARQGFIFNLFAPTIKMTVAMATANEFEEIRRDTYENADDNFEEEPDDEDGDEEEEEEEEVEAGPVSIAPPPAPPVVAPTPQPSYLPSAETLSVPEDSP